MIGPLLSSTPLLAALLWIIALVVNPGPYDPGAVFLIGWGLATSGTVSVVGLVLVGGRWSRRLAQTVLAGTFLIAAARPFDGLWLAAAIVSAFAVIALASHPVRDGVRKLPAATGPPDRAVMLALVLLMTPLALGIVSWAGSSQTTVLTGLLATLASLWYTRVLPAGLYLARYVWPSVAMALAFTQPLAPAIVSAALGIMTAFVAADTSVKTAFYPLTGQGTSYPIPPELAPKEILEAADLDERGRPK